MTEAVSPCLSLESTKAFLTALHGSESGSLWVARTSDKRGFKVQYPAQIRILHETLCDWTETEDVWVSAHLLRPDAKRRKKEFFADRDLCIAVDLDGLDYQELLVAPTFVVETSPGHYHAYWILTEPLGRFTIEDIQKRITHHHALRSSDKGTWDISRVLRIPGTINHRFAARPDGTLTGKDGIKHVTRLIEVAAEARYTVDDFADYPNVFVDTSQSDYYLPEATYMKVPNWLEDKFTEDENVTDDRSGKVWNLIDRLMQLGYPDAEILGFVFQYSPFKDKWGGEFEQDNEKVESGNDELRRSFSKLRQRHPHEATNCWRVEPEPCEHRSKNPKTGEYLDEPSYTYENELLRISKKAPERVRVWEIKSPEDHEIPPPPQQFLIPGIWPENSHGPIAGGKKTFKSYNALAMSIAIGSGVAYLGQFPVLKSGPVFYFIGEGGYESWQRRHNRICEAYGIKPKESNVFAVAETAPIDSSDFAEAVEFAKKEIDPIAFILDPLYAYHPQGIEAQNLYSRGKMLSDLDALIGHDRALMIPDHMKKSSPKQTLDERLDLDEISQAGMSQWADSWILHTHREPYDRLAGVAHLAVEYGSRRGYGKRFAIDLTVGPFNDATGDHDGIISWDVTPLEEVEEKKSSKKQQTAVLTSQMLRQKLVDDLGTGELTKGEVAKFCATHYDISQTQSYTKVPVLEKQGFIVATDEKKRKFRVVVK